MYDETVQKSEVKTGFSAFLFFLLVDGSNSFANN